MDALLDPIRDIVEGQIDFQGQRTVDFLSTALLTVTGILAFLAGYTTNDISKSLWTGLGGTAITFLITVPPWPAFNKHPERWLPPRTAPVNRQHIQIQMEGDKTR